MWPPSTHNRSEYCLTTVPYQSIIAAHISLRYIHYFGGRQMVQRRTATGTSSLTTALIYTRVSSEEQAREGVTLDAQLAECRRYAAQHGWLLGGEYQDVMSGK